MQCFPMATESKPSANPDTAAAAKNRKRKRYLPHNKPVKKKGSYRLRPGVQGFFITCNGGREHQASREALNIIDSGVLSTGEEIRNGVELKCVLEKQLLQIYQFYEELVHGEDTSAKELSSKPVNTKIRFSDSDSSSSDDDDDDAREREEVQEGEKENEDKKHKSDDSNDDGSLNDNGTGDKSDPGKIADMHAQEEEKANDNTGDIGNHGTVAKTTDEPLAKKQCCNTEVRANVSSDQEEKSIDRLIEAELKELGDKGKRRFGKIDSGCNGLVFIQMRKKGDTGPKDIVQHMVTSAASKKKHISRFILRILPIEVSCYASEEEISKAIKPLVEQYFPVEAQNPQKFAVMYEARANSGIDRMKIIDAVAKSVPGPHKVDLKNPEKTIVVEIVKTICLIGVIEKYKEFAKYNLRQLTSSKI